MAICAGWAACKNDNHRVKMSSPFSLFMQVKKRLDFLEETNPCTLPKSS